MNKIIFFSLLILSSFFPVNAFYNLNTSQKNIHIDVTKADPNRWEMNGTYPETRNITLESLSKRAFTAQLTGVFDNLRSVDIHSFHTNLDVDLTGQMPSLEEVTVESTSGNIKAKIGYQLNPSVRSFAITATSGNIHLNVNPDSNVKVVASTKSGNFGASSLVHKSGVFSKREYTTPKFDPYKPYTTIEIKTTSGDISLY